MSESKLARSFQDRFVFCDDDSWIWNWLRDSMRDTNIDFVKMGTSTPIRHSWDRFKHAQHIVVHWEAERRSGGAIVEELLECDPIYDVGEKVIVVTTNPTREDVVYFSELGIRKIIKLRNRDREIVQASQELNLHLRNTRSSNPLEQAWRGLLRAIEILPENPPFERILRIESALDLLKAKEAKLSARYHDAFAYLRLRQKNYHEAEKNWLLALEKNSNYFRSYHGLIKMYRERGELEKAYALMQKMHALNRNHISRLAEMGEIQAKLGEESRAEHYFKSALERDSSCARALNGLAGIRFRAGELEESRKLLSKSKLAYEMAKELNEHGISLVKEHKYRDALEHYTKAQYVIPQQEKGPMLFYNIGLCYSRWKKPEMAKEFLKLALIKEPNYDKAKKLLHNIELQAAN